MRLSPDHIKLIQQGALRFGGAKAQVWLFGSRVHDDQRGGDIDLLLDVPTSVDEPAQVAAKLAGFVSRGVYGRKVDVVVRAPNLLPLPIHKVAMTEGVLL